MSALQWHHNGFISNPLWQRLEAKLQKCSYCPNSYVPDAKHDTEILLFGVFGSCADRLCDALPGDHRAASRWRSCTPSWRRSWKPRRRPPLHRKRPPPWTLGFTRWPSPPLLLPQPRLFEAQQNQYHWLTANKDTSSWVFQKTGTFYRIVCCITFHERYSLAVCQSSDTEVQLFFFKGHVVTFLTLSSCVMTWYAVFSYVIVISVFYLNSVSSATIL